VNYSWQAWQAEQCPGHTSHSPSLRSVWIQAKWENWLSTEKPRISVLSALNSAWRSENAVISVGHTNLHHQHTRTKFQMPCNPKRSRSLSIHSSNTNPQEVPLGYNMSWGRVREEPSRQLIWPAQRLQNPYAAGIPDGLGRQALKWHMQQLLMPRMCN